MTRKKKTRSLKSIHSVKTGSVSKLKRDSTTDRQSSNLKGKNKPKSVYQKFLDENPDAIEKQQQPISPEKAAEKLAEIALKAEQAAAAKAAAKKPRTNPKFKKEEKEVVEKEREPDLLGQLDNKNFKDFY
ncbi:hypothetical protein A9R00_08625 [Oleispira antarctica]|uniref:Uncharacterized protein n=1 Tax=Oleispira antarctica TaxID=188908 RepID=A0A1Y5HRH4_OLEAN|nr:hypothetical protein A9R00_08625 [Oleispira antarctica]